MLSEFQQEELDKLQKQAEAGRAYANKNCGYPYVDDVIDFFQQIIDAATRIKTDGR